MFSPFSVFLLHFSHKYDNIETELHFQGEMNMSFLFSKCSDATENALSSRTFGAYYSESQNQDLSVHSHDCCEIFLCLSGGGFFLIDGTLYEVEGGDLFVLNQFEPHKITTDPDRFFARFALQIHPEYLYQNSTNKTDLARCFYNREQGTCNKIPLSDSEIAEMEQLFILFRQNSGLGDDILKNAAANHILVLANRFFAKQTPENTKEKIDTPLTKTISYINSHLFEELSLELLSKNASVSVNQLCKLFKNQYGTTVAKYIVAKRISEAKKLLLKGKSVSKTALLCGFPDYANFIRVFKKIVGVSPGKYSKL